VRAVLDFAPVRVSSPPEVQVRQVDLSGELMCLSFRLNRDDEKR
jgi:NADH/NAD ratio-sensing transcriptional regulator Rex